QDADRGIKEIKETLDLEPDHIPALVALARTYLKRSEPQAALPYAQKAVKSGPQDLTARMALGDVLLATGDAAGAARELEVVVRLAPGSPAGHYRRARACTKLGREGEARRERDACQKAPRAAEDAGRETA